MNAMRQIIDKCGLHVLHLQNVIANTPEKVDWVTVKGKLKKLCNANILLRCAFFNRHSHTSQNFSLETQKCDAFVVDIFDRAETTCTYHVKMVEKLMKTPD